LGAAKSATFCNKLEWSLHYADVEEEEDAPRPDLMIRPRIIRSWDELLLLSTKSSEDDLMMRDYDIMGRMLTAGTKHR
jgi:hypothetical protein